MRLFILLMLMTVPCLAGDLAQEGIAAYEKGQWDVAKQDFSQLLDDSRWRSAALYNLGNIAVRQKHLGEALGYYRRALQKNPHDQDTRFNLRLALKELGMRNFPGSRSNWEIFRSGILNYLTLAELLVGMMVVGSFFLGNLLKYLRQRRLANFNNEPYERTPHWITFAWGGLFIFFLAGTVLKITDSFTERATVVVSKVDLRSGPSESNASLSEITEGSEVLILNDSQGWKQVSSLDGSRTGITGWVPDSALMITTGGGPW